mgnify:CR=1 FL=1
MTIVHFTPVYSLIGGLLIGAAAAGMLLISGRIAGVSGIAAGVMLPFARGDRAWRWSFVLGLVVTGMVFARIVPDAFAVYVGRSTLALIAAGLLVGIGTRIGSGCTSGHGICGIGRWSPRSIVATLVFMMMGMITVYVVQHILGGTL